MPKKAAGRLVLPTWPDGQQPLVSPEELEEWNQRRLEAPPDSTFERQENAMGADAMRRARRGTD